MSHCLLIQTVCPLRGERCQPPLLPDFSLLWHLAVGGRCDSHVVRAAESVHGGIKGVRPTPCHPAQARNPRPLLVLQESLAVIFLWEREDPKSYMLPAPLSVCFCFV